MNRRTLTALVLIGILGGLTGFVLTEILHFFQHIAFAYEPGQFASFIQGVQNAAPERRVLALLAAGLIGGIGWYLIHRCGAPLVPLGQAVKPSSRPLPTFTTVCHALLQIVTVGMGSPLGRETAPREMTAALSNIVLRCLRPPEEDRTLLIACAAGAGLAAVYNAPFSAAVFTLETLILAWDRKSVIAVLLTCGMATLIVRLTLGPALQYTLPEQPFAPSLIVWTLFFSPLVALAVFLFQKSDASLPKIDPKSPWIILVSVLAFGLIGVLSIWYPAILGNGKPGNELTFADLISAPYALKLFAAKWGAILLAAVAGAYGGRLTPSMMLGSTLGLSAAVLWNICLQSMGLSFLIIPVGGAAFVGAALYLGLNQKMPMTAAIFLIEISHWSIEYAFPFCFGMGLSLVVFERLKSY